MTQYSQIYLFQVVLLGFATIGRFAYYGVSALFRKSAQNSWGEVRRIGSDLCLMSFGAVASAGINPNSMLSVENAKNPIFFIFCLLIFLLLYIASYALFKETVTPRPVFEKSWGNAFRLVRIMLSFMIGLVALGHACKLALTFTG